MSFYERCRKFTVKVSGGSGVIFQPMTDEYSYILTAKHNLYNDPNIMQKVKETIEIEACDITINFDQNDRYEHETLDIAILKIDKIDIDTPFKEFEKLTKDLNYEFYGYPDYKRQENGKIENYKVSFSKQDASLITCDNSNFSDIEEIKGASGGGLFREKDEKIYLVAIEYEMNAKKKSKATHGRIDFISIEAFDDIIKANDLAPLLSSTLIDFRSYKDELLEYFDIKAIQDLLDEEVENILLKDITPIKIIRNLENNLFYPSIRNYEAKINDKELWKGWLFYLALINIYLDGKEDINKFIQDNNNIYHLYIDNYTKTINSYISDILRDKDSYFNENSTILFNTKKDITNKNYCYYSKDIPKDIFNPYSRNDDDKMYIDQVLKRKKISFILLKKIKDKVGEISKTERNEIRRMIQKEIFCKRSLFQKILNKLGKE